MTSNIFTTFRKNLQVHNSDDISTSYKSITKRLNKDFWDLESDSEKNSLQVGSYGRHTAIRDVSDLDMVFELPDSLFDKYDQYESNGQSQLLQEVRSSLSTTFSKTTIRGDGQVVVIEFSNYRVEVLPCFLDKDGKYTFPDSNNGGSWQTCHPKLEISVMNEANSISNRNLKNVCKMLRSWKNHTGAPINGYLIDTLTYKFFQQDHTFDNSSFGSYPQLLVSVFSFFANLDQSQEYWLAPGSGTRVYKTGNFQKKAKKAAQKCQEALDEENENKKIKLWKELFGKYFPSPTALTESSSHLTFDKAYSNANSAKSSEEFIEDKFPVEIQYELEIECNVSFSGKDELKLRSLEYKFPWLKLGRNLDFKIVQCTVPEPYDIYWKVRNVGEYAVRHKMVRGQIYLGNRSKHETTSFGGEHFVECYIVKNSVCVARDLIDVPITLQLST